MSDAKTGTAMVHLSVGDATSLAEKLVKSNLLPDKLRGKEADILFTILAGTELGMGPMAAIRGMHVVEGKPTLAADTMVGLALASGQCEYFVLVEGSDKVATYETKRRGAPTPQRMSFSIVEAQKAKLLGKDNWQKYTAAMLRARAKAALARDVYSDVLAGIYDPDEVGTGPERVVDVEHRDIKPDNVIDVEPEPEQPDADLIQRLEEKIALAKGEGTQALEALMTELRPLPEGPAKDNLRALYKDAYKAAAMARMSAPASSTSPSAAQQPSPSSSSPPPSSATSSSGPATTPTTTSLGDSGDADSPSRSAPPARGAKAEPAKRRASAPTGETQGRGRSGAPPAATAPASVPSGNPPGVPQEKALDHDVELEMQDLEKTAKELHENPAWVADFAEKLAKMPDSRRTGRLWDVLHEVRAGIEAEQAAADAAAEVDHGR